MTLCKPLIKYRRKIQDLALGMSIIRGRSERGRVTANIFCLQMERGRGCQIGGGGFISSGDIGSGLSVEDACSLFPEGGSINSEGFLLPPPAISSASLWRQCRPPTDGADRGVRGVQEAPKQKFVPDVEGSDTALPQGGVEDPGVSNPQENLSNSIPESGDVRLLVEVIKWSNRHRHSERSTH